MSNFNIFLALLSATLTAVSSYSSQDYKETIRVLVFLKVKMMLLGLRQALSLRPNMKSSLDSSREEAGLMR